MLLVPFRPRRVAYHASSLGTFLISVEELGIFLDDGSVVSDGSAVVAYVGKESGTVECCHHVVRVN